MDIIKGEVKMIDIENRKMAVAGLRKPLYFDKILVAWGADKNRLGKSYTNVHYIEDRFSHAKVHNSLLKAQKVVIMGNTLDAIQTASSTRNFLDECGLYKTEVTLMTTDIPDARRSMGPSMDMFIKKQLSEQRINYEPNVNIVKLEGEMDLEAIYFNKELEYGKGHPVTTDYFIKPDLVICENGIGRPKRELLSYVGYQD